MTETQLKNKVLAMIKKEFPNCFVWKINDKTTSGIPDLLVILRGIITFIELKVPGGKTSKIQDYQIQRIMMAGGRAYMADSVDRVKGILYSAMKEADLVQSLVKSHINRER